jgi:hypothetical protein
VDKTMESKLVDKGILLYLPAFIVQLSKKSNATFGVIKIYN